MEPVSCVQTGFAVVVVVAPLPSSAIAGMAHRLRAMTALNKPVKNLLFFFMTLPLFICLWFVFMVCIGEQLTCPSPLSCCNGIPVSTTPPLPAAARSAATGWARPRPCAAGSKPLRLLTVRAMLYTPCRHHGVTLAKRQRRRARNRPSAVSVNSMASASRV